MTDETMHKTSALMALRLDRGLARQVLQVLVGARKRIEDPSRWTKGRFRQVKDGHACYCALGAVRASRAPHYLKAEAMGRLEKVLSHRVGHWNIVNFNDREATTHEQVLEVFDQAIADLREFLS
jgi:hypothetical protein